MSSDMGGDGGVNYCHECGAELNQGENYCPDCGTNRHDAGTNKSTGLAAILSFFIVGVGQLYLGLTRRGLVWLFGSMAIGVVMGLTAPRAVIMFGLLLAVGSAIDAAIMGSRMKYVEQT